MSATIADAATVTRVWLPLIRRMAKRDWPSHAELRRAIRGAGTVPPAWRSIVNARLAGAFSRPAHRPASPAEVRLKRWLWPAIDVQMAEAQLRMAGEGRQSRRLALEQIAAGLRRPVSPDHLKDKIEELRHVRSLAVLLPAPKDCERLLTDPDVLSYRAERAKRTARKELD